MAHKQQPVRNQSAYVSSSGDPINGKLLQCLIKFWLPEARSNSIMAVLGVLGSTLIVATLPNRHARLTRC